jgi:hypothetical protein
LIGSTNRTGLYGTLKAVAVNELFGAWGKKPFTIPLILLATLAPL